MNRSGSTVAAAFRDPHEAHQSAVAALSTLEAEVIMLVALPEDQRSRLVRLVSAVREDMHCALSGYAGLMVSTTGASQGAGQQSLLLEKTQLSLTPLAAASPAAPSAPRVGGTKGGRSRHGMSDATQSIASPRAKHRGTRVASPELHAIRGDAVVVPGVQSTICQVEVPVSEGDPSSTPHPLTASASAAIAPHGGGGHGPSALMTQLSSSAMPSNYGHCISASLYMILEGLLVACHADRLALYSRSPMGNTLTLAAMCGHGVVPAKKGIIASPVSVVQAVYQTRIAANLDTVTLEDVAECQGPSAAKNALVFPVYFLSEEKRDVEGVVMLVNKQRGSRPFDASDEQILHQRLPSVGYILHQYPFDYHAYPMDAAPLHRLAPLPVWAPPAVSIPKSLTCAPFLQKVFHRNGKEKYIRREALASAEDVVQLETVAEQLVSVEGYLTVMEECWKRGISDRVEVELSLRQKMQHLADAREILIRKQKKFDVLKETLCEQLERQVTESRAVGGKGGSIASFGSLRASNTARR